MAAAKGSRSACQIEQLLDVGVFAPLGLLLTREQTVADLAAAGRKQVAFTRSLGRAALKGIAKGAPTSKQPTAKQTAPSKPPRGEIDGYSSMTARELVQLARTCTDAQATWLRAAETAGKARVTVLRALDDRAAVDERDL